MTHEILFAGFGGQGILFSGKFVAYDALLRDKEVSWLPSYGPEMRGGTASCSVIVSDTPVGSPIISNPTVLVAMNLPSLDRYEAAVVKGGSIFIDSTLIARKVVRDDVNAYYIPSTQLASDMELAGLANMIMLGFMINKTGIMTLEQAKKTVEKVVPAKKQNMLEFNNRAIELGWNYK